METTLQVLSRDGVHTVSLPESLSAHVRASYDEETQEEILETLGLLLFRLGDQAEETLLEEIQRDPAFLARFSPEIRHELAFEPERYGELTF